MPKPTVPTGFDYSTVPAGDRKWLKEVTASIKDATTRVRTDLIAIGQWITSVKNRLPHGAYEAWCAAALPYGKATALRLTQVARVFGGEPDTKNVTVTDLPRAVENLEPSAMYALAAPSCPPAAREKALALAGSGERVTQEVARQFIDEARESDPPRNRGVPVMRCLQDLIDRVEAAIEDGRIVQPEVPEPPEGTPLPVPLWMLARLYAILFPEEFPADRPDGPPVDHPPGSDPKIAVMQHRVEMGLSPCSKDDPGLDDPRGVIHAKRSGGAGKVIDGVRKAAPSKPMGWLKAK